MKRILVISDLHCGHLVGLTPPGWQIRPNANPDDTQEIITKREKFWSMQKACWDWFESSIKKFGPYDCVLVNGDAIDGPGSRSGGTEQITTDRNVQVEMAVYAIRKAFTKRETQVVMTYGTGYHTGDAEDFENIIARDLGAKIGSHEWIDAEGVIIDAKHHISSSSVPHTRHTAVAREALWATLWAQDGLIPNPDILIRSHVHYHQYCGDGHSLRMTTPALQGFGSKYGSRRCSGLVDYGFIVIECSRGEYAWKKALFKSKEFCATATKI